jgi:hypothetical protein
MKPTFAAGGLLILCLLLSACYRGESGHAVLRIPSAETTEALESLRLSLLEEEANLRGDTRLYVDIRVLPELPGLDITFWRRQLAVRNLEVKIQRLGHQVSALPSEPVPSGNSETTRHGRVD